MSLENLVCITALRVHYIKPFRFLPGHRGGKRGWYKATLCKAESEVIPVQLLVVGRSSCLPLFAIRLVVFSEQAMR